MNYSNHPITKEYRQLLRRTETPSERMNEEVENNINHVIIKIKEKINQIINLMEERTLVQTPNPLT